MISIEPGKNYKHFKGDVYTVHGYSEPVEHLKNSFIPTKMVEHTETGKYIGLFLDIDTGKLYHFSDQSKDTLVIYSKPQERIWARPYDDFMSKIHIGRQDNKTRQPFRFMLIK